MRRQSASNLSGFGAMCKIEFTMPAVQQPVLRTGALVYPDPFTVCLGQATEKRQERGTARVPYPKIVSRSTKRFARAAQFPKSLAKAQRVPRACAF